MLPKKKQKQESKNKKLNYNFVKYPSKQYKLQLI